MGAQWCDKSGANKQTAFSEDSLRALAKMMQSRKRNYIYSMNACLISKDRTDLCARLPVTYKKVALVSDEHLSKLPGNMDAATVTLPTKDEGFNEVEFLNGE